MLQQGTNGPGALRWGCHFWGGMPEAASKDEFYIGSHGHGFAFHDLPLSATGAEPIRIVRRACTDKAAFFSEISAIAEGYSPITLIACRHYRLPVVTASADNGARLWDAQSGKKLARLAHEDSVRAVAFSPAADRTSGALSDRRTTLSRPRKGAQRAASRAISASNISCRITGPVLEAERDSAKWRPMWPHR